MVMLHRWFGLAAALFLFVSGLTGAVISWDHELDAWLNPQLFQAASGACRSGKPGWNWRASSKRRTRACASTTRSRRPNPATRRCSPSKAGRIRHGKSL
jgi:uncharacterized iron-regulated membrane protein